MGEVIPRAVWLGCIRNIAVQARESKAVSNVPLHFPLWLLPSGSCPEFLPLLSSVMNYNHEGKEISSSQVAFGHGVYHSNRISN